MSKHWSGGMCLQLRETGPYVLLVFEHHEIIGKSHWGIPGGRCCHTHGSCDCGEDPIQTLRREIQEETAHTVKNVLGRILRRKETCRDQSYKRFVYLVETREGPLVLPQASAQWFPLGNLPSGLHKAHRRFIMRGTKLLFPKAKGGDK